MAPAPSWPLALRQGVALANFTSWKVGGAAEWLAEPGNQAELSCFNTRSLYWFTLWQYFVFIIEASGIITYVFDRYSHRVTQLLFLLTQLLFLLTTCGLHQQC